MVCWTGLRVALEVAQCTSSFRLAFGRHEVASFAGGVEGMKQVCVCVLQSKMIYNAIESLSY